LLERILPGAGGKEKEIEMIKIGKVSVVPGKTTKTMRVPEDQQ
jgi:hypothetical protein